MSFTVIFKDVTEIEGVIKALAGMLIFSSCHVTKDQLTVDKAWHQILHM